LTPAADAAAPTPSENRLVVRRFSEEETANPYVPRGIDVRLSLSISIGGSESLLTPSLRPPPPEVTDELGVPFLDPPYAFGLVRAAKPPAQAPPSATGSGLQVIGATATRSAVYAVTLLGRESLDEHAAYHLRLAPLRDPGRNRLRDLWVDVDSYVTRKARVSGNFIDEPLASTPWTIGFRTIGDAQYIATERAELPIRYKARRAYDEASISFEQVTPETGGDPLAMRLGMPPVESGLREPPR